MHNNVGTGNIKFEKENIILCEYKYASNKNIRWKNLNSYINE